MSDSAESLHQQYEPDAPIHKAVNITSRMLKDRVEPFQHDEYDLWKARDPETGRESDHWWDTPEEAVEFLVHDIDLDLCCVNECDNYLGEDSDRIMCDECHPDEYIECAEDGCDYPTNHVKTDYCSGHTWRNGRTADEKKLVTDGGEDVGQAVKQTPSLKFADEHVDPILKGQKTMTLRLSIDREAFQIGRRFHLCDEDGERFASAFVEDRGYTTAAMAATMNFDGHRNYRNVNHLIEELREYYPDAALCAQTALEIVRWNSGDLWE